MSRKTIKMLIAASAIFVSLAVFAVQNFHAKAPVRMLFWRIGNAPLSVIIFASILIGFGIAGLEFLPRLIRYRRRALQAEGKLRDMRG